MNSKLLYLLLALFGVVSATSAENAATGEKWRVTTTMQMQGMSMPGNTSEVCKAAGNEELPIQPDKNCQITDAKRVGNTQSFKMRCTGKEAMEGSGELTYLGPDRYKGKMQVNVGGGQMTMAYEGQKLGACDGSELNTRAKKMMEQGQQQAAAATKQQCHEAAQAATMPALMGNCKDPQDIKTYCSNFQTHKIFMAQGNLQAGYAKQGTTPVMKPLDDSARLCGVGVAALRTNLCSTAESSNQLDFIGKECAAQSAELVKAQCAGRRYTAINEKYRGFCSSYAGIATPNGDDAPPAASEPSKGLFGKGKKALGGLFGK
jgi:Protein of unknown function (DUF3617)